MFVVWWMRPQVPGPNILGMGRFNRRNSYPPSDVAGPEEDQVVRQYRYLLRTAPPDALEAAHTEALARLPRPQRAALLATVQNALVAGQRLTADDCEPLAHLMTLGERRSPGVLLGEYPTHLRRDLAEGVIHSEAVFGLFGGYASWDGSEPQSKDDPEQAAAGFTTDSGRWSLDKKSQADAAYPGFTGELPP